MSKTELKPCPFCGGQVKTRRFRPYDIPGFLCDHCGAVVSFRGEPSGIYDGSFPVKAWNRRWEVEIVPAKPEKE